jgi:hypothetical protein
MAKIFEILQWDCNEARVEWYALVVHCNNSVSNS